MSDLKVITLKVDGELVRGQITARTARVISIRLLEPLGKLTGTCTIPLFASHHASFLTPTGDATARQVIAETYRRAVFFERNAGELRQAWRSTQAELIDLEHNDPDSPDRVAVERREIRDAFRGRAITARENQILLRRLRARERAFEDRRREVLAAFEAPWKDASNLDGVVTFLGEDTRGLRPHDRFADFDVIAGGN